MEQWMVFVQERWFVILAAIVVLWLVFKIIRTMVKWLIVLGIIVAIVWYGSSYTSHLTDLFY